MKTILLGLMMTAIMTTGASAQKQESNFGTSEMGDTYVAREQVYDNNRIVDSIVLNSADRYFITVEGTMYFDKRQFDGALHTSDPCYNTTNMHNGEKPKIENMFRNSMNISVCNDSYHGSHFYRSRPFMGNNEIIRFGIAGHNYTRNGVGIFEVKIYKKKRQQQPRNQCTCEDRLRLGRYTLYRGNQLIEYVGGFSDCNDLRRTHPQCQ